MEHTQRMKDIESRLEELSKERDQLQNELHPLIIEQIKPNLDTLKGIHEIKVYLTNFGEYCGMVKFDLYNLIMVKEKELKA
jgi:predicted transcriptional regulator